MGGGSHFWLVAAVFVCWWLLVVILDGRSHFWAVSMTTNDNQCHCLLFGCHVAVGNVAPGFCVKKMIGRGEMSLLTLDYCCSAK